MKIIKYGKGYKPKRVTCEHCNSKITYNMEEIHIIDKESHIGFKCLVCKQWIVLGAVNLPIDLIVKYSQL